MLPSLYEYALLPKRMLLQLGLFTIALIWWFDFKNQKKHLFHSALYLPIICYFLFATVSITQATNSTTAIIELAHQLTFVGLFILAYHTFQIENFPKFLRICATVGIVVSFMGILEARGIDANWFPLSNGRPSATFEYRNFAAAYLILSLPLTLLLWIQAKKNTDFLLGIVATTMMLTFLIYTRTRGAWVGFLGAICITLFIASFAKWRWKTPFAFTICWKNKTNQAITALAVILLVFLATLPPQIASPHSRAIDEGKLELANALSFATAPQADRGRRTLWTHTIAMIQDHPLLGVGLNNWQYLYPLYDQGDMIGAQSAPVRPHNDWLWIASEMGIPAWFIYMWFLTTIALMVVRILQNTKNPYYGLYTLAISASLLAMLGHGQVSFPKERIETNFIFWFGLGIIAQIATHTQNAKPIHHPITKWGILSIPLVLLFCTGLSYCHIQFDRHYLRAYEYHQGNQYQGVIMEANQALKWGNFNPQIYFLQGNGYRYTNQPLHAENAYLQGLRYHPYSVQFLKALGTAFALQNKLDLAEKTYDKALEIYPDYAPVYNDLGNIYQQRQEFSKAIAAYKKASHLNDPTTQRNLALAFVATDSTQQAIALYRNLITSQPSDIALFYELGEAYFKHASQDPNAYIQARAAFNHFLKHWQGDPQFKQIAQTKLQAIQTHLTQTP
jgi:O-antigen ligase